MRSYQIYLASRAYQTGDPRAIIRTVEADSEEAAFEAFLRTVQLELHAAFRNLRERGAVRVQPLSSPLIGE